MAATLAAATMDAPVPTCPDWVTRDLAFHLGGVQRWATAFVLTGASEPGAVDFGALAGPRPADEALVAWFSQGHAALVGALRQAPPDVQCWTFMPAASPLAFWARRQAHETSIHRVDAELAAGRIPTPVGTVFGVDGTDELLTGFAPRRQGDPRAASPKSVLVRCDDADASWRVTVSAEGVAGERGDGAGAADCVVHGRASDLYQGLWNRLPNERLSIEGDAVAYEILRNRALVR